MYMRDSSETAENVCSEQFMFYICGFQILLYQNKHLFNAISQTIWDNFVWTFKEEMMWLLIIHKALLTNLIQMTML